MYTTDIPYEYKHYYFLTRLMLLLQSVGIIQIHFKYGVSSHNVARLYGHGFVNCTRFQWSPSIRVG